MIKIQCKYIIIVVLLAYSEWDKLEEFDLNVLLLDDKTEAHVEVGAPTLSWNPLSCELRG